ncbi:MAG: hypothetical protein PHI53_02700 [Candidatus Pacebacteria bacterium]|nr:hypothetical protein [Candidatus Paceibacterota bacterium]
MKLKEETKMSISFMLFVITFILMSPLLLFLFMAKKLWGWRVIDNLF